MMAVKFFQNLFFCKKLLAQKGREYDYLSSNYSPHSPPQAG
jgi:hypothetical protein